MENLTKRILWVALTVSSLWLFVIGLSVSAIVFLFKALLEALVPAVGYANAYLICSLLCAALIGVAYLYMRRLRPSPPLHLPETAQGGGLSPEGISQLIREHPLEAATVAFTLGFSVETGTDLINLLQKTGQQMAKS